MVVTITATSRLVFLDESLQIWRHLLESTVSEWLLEVRLGVARSTEVAHIALGLIIKSCSSSPVLARGGPADLKRKLHVSQRVVLGLGNPKESKTPIDGPVLLACRL